MYDNISLCYPENEKCSRKICRENQNTFYDQLLISENRGTYYVVDSLGTYGRARHTTYGNTTMRMCLTCWIPKATYTLS